MKKTSSVVVGVILSAMVCGAAQAAQPFTGNITATNNYLWRGVTQTNDQAAIQGGADYDFGNNVAIGAWTSNVTGGTELDLYGSYKFHFAKDITVDVGGVQYKYPSQSNLDFLEAFAKFSQHNFVAALYYTLSKQSHNVNGGISEHDVYFMGSYTIDLGKNRSLSLLAGHYDFAESANTTTGDFTDYTHFRAAFTKGEFTAAVDKNDLNGNAGRARFSISWSRAFDL